MPETLTILLAAHLLGDFVLQPDRMVRAKGRFEVLLAHVGVVTGLTWVLLGGWPVGLLAVLFATHTLIDAAKQAVPEPVRRRWTVFLADQGAHVAVAILLAWLVPDAWRDGWGRVLDPGGEAIWMLGATAAGGIVLSVWAGGSLVGSVMQPLAEQLPEAERRAGLERGGKLIGQLERLLVLILVVVGQPGGIGFIVAAKSILRIGEIRRGTDDADSNTPDSSRKLTEYIIIGTFLSFAWGLAAAALTAWWLARWWAAASH